MLYSRLKVWRKTRAAKINAPSLLERELLRKARKKEYGFIALSSATEPWMHAEEKKKLTRECLKVIARFAFSVHCLTKSTLISRDLDLLKEIDRRAILPEDLNVRRGVLITFSISTLDERVARIFEPNAPKPKDRLETLQIVKEAGFCAGIACIPLLPFISDSDEQMEEVVMAAKEFQADYVFAGALTLHGVWKDVYFRVVEKHFPDLLPKYRRIFKFSGYPSRAYQMRIDRKMRELCEKQGVKYRIP